MEKGSFHKGDHVTIRYLPKSKVILDIRMADAGEDYFRTPVFQYEKATDSGKQAVYQVASDGSRIYVSYSERNHIEVYSMDGTFCGSILFPWHTEGRLYIRAFNNKLYIKEEEDIYIFYDGTFVERYVAKEFPFGKNFFTHKKGTTSDSPVILKGRTVMDRAGQEIMSVSKIDADSSSAFVFVGIPLFAAMFLYMAISSVKQPHGER